MDENHRAALTIRSARADEGGYLSDLAMRSKAHWGYSREFMDACRDELTFSALDVANPQHLFHVAELNGIVVGFSALRRVSSTEWELDALFVEPDVIRRGVGMALIENAKSTVRSRGADVLVIQGDPHAEGFYVAAGARRIGERESGSVAGRYLPLFSIAICRNASK